MSWNQHLKKFEALDYEQDQKWQLGAQFMHAVGQQFLQAHQLVQKRTDSEIELRGAWHGSPARAKLDVAFGTLEWEMKAPNPTQRRFFFHWDMDAVPAVGEFSGEAASAWDGDGGEAKVFFGKGYYLDAEPYDIEGQLAAYQALPEPVRAALSTHMIGDRIARLYVYDYGELSLGFEKNVQEMADPINQVGRGAWLLGQIAWGLGQIDLSKLPAVEQPAAEGVVYKMTCRYCSTLYLWSQTQRCPNCGAAPQ